MTKDEFANVVAAVLGIHATEGRVDTIVFAADAYAAVQIAAAVTPAPKEAAA
jgi:hypothetical protein